MKKYWFMGLVFVMLLGAVVLNARANNRVITQNEAPQTEARNETEPSEEETTVLGYFDAFRQDRDAVRNEEISYLDEVIAVSSTDAETLEDAQTQKLALIDNMEKEFIIEALITAKGFSNAAVLFHGGSVNVVVETEAEKLTDEQVAQILDIVQRETGESASNIRIVQR